MDGAEAGRPDPEQQLGFADLQGARRRVMDAELRSELGNFIALFEAHKGERVTLTPGQALVLLMLMKMFQDLARRLNGEWKRG